MAESAVTMKSVSFTYDGQNVLQDVHLQVGAGDFLAIIGPNGGGKTTLLKLMLGILRPVGGEVRVFGKNPARHRPRVGYVPQHASTKQRFPITVLDVVLMGLGSGRRYGPGHSKEEKGKALDALQRVDAVKIKDSRFDELSGGQRQRVLVARGIVGDPDILIFDEPTSNIDPRGKVCMYDMMAELNKTKTLILVSHDLVVTSAGITSIAAVNRRLIQQFSKELTPEMLDLIYGYHEATCPVGHFLKGLPTIIEPPEVH